MLEICTLRLGIFYCQDEVSGRHQMQFFSRYAAVVGHRPGRNDSKAPPPKFAIANGLFIGVLPDEYQDSTPTENAMLNLSQPTRFLAVVRGGKHSALRSHAYYFRAEPATPAHLLPNEIVTQGIIGVTMTGALTEDQKLRTMKKYEARPTRLQEQLSWYIANNHLYAEIRRHPESSPVMHPTSVVLDRTGPGTRQRSVETASDGLDDATWRHNAPAPAHLNVSADDELFEQAATALLSDFTRPDDLTTMQQAMESQDVIVRRSSEILSDFDPAFCSLSFCELFPYGRGGLEEPRKIKIGLEEYIRYCLRLSTRRHSKHPSFALVAFDVIARHRAIQAISIRAKLAPGVPISAAAVTRDELLSHVQHQEARLRALAGNGPSPAEPHTNRHVTDLYSGISTGMRAFWGSNEERSEARQNLFAMQLALGQPSLFFTVSPDSSLTFRIANLAGDIDSHLLDAIEDTMNVQKLFSRARTGMIATQNPVACARYFHRTMDIIIDVLFDWDQIKQCPRGHGGLFGTTQAFYASTESQSSTGSLHSHMMIWIEEMPETLEEYARLRASERFQKQLRKYVDSILRASYPISGFDCPCCGLRSIEPVPVSQQAFKKPRKGSTCPPTSRCRSCSATYGADELVRKSLIRLCEKSIEMNRELDPTIGFYRMAMPQPLPRWVNVDTMPAVISAQALLAYQNHHWFHSKSCFKHSKRTPKGDSCRMFFPKSVCGETSWTKAGSLEIKRMCGSEYLNPYIPVVNEVIKSNHDLKVLIACEGPHVGFYMMKYSTKSQKDIENPLALHLGAFDKATTNADPSLDKLQSGRRRMQSMCCSLSNAHEVSAPMASLYLLHESAFYSSHSFSKVYLNGFVSALFERESREVILSKDENGMEYKPSCSYLDYIFFIVLRN